MSVLSVTVMSIK